MTAPRASARAPWQPSPVQAPLLTALIGAKSLQSARLRAWCDSVGTASPPGEVVDLLSLAARAMQSAAPDAPVTALAMEVYHETATRNLLRISRLLGVLARFETAGIPAVLLKGAALALRYYRNFGARAMGDIDVLVRTGDVASAYALLLSCGWRTPSPLFDLAARVRTSHALALINDAGDSVDLHWRLMPGSTPEFELDIWEQCERVTVAERSVRVLRREYALLHVCLHAIQPDWSPSPRWLCDVAAMLDDTQDEPLAWDALATIAQRTGTSVRLRAALDEYSRYAEQRVGAEIESAFDDESLARQQAELSLFTRMPPYSRADILAWHWHLFRRLRTQDAVWRRWPSTLGFVDYVRLKRQQRAR